VTDWVLLLPTDLLSAMRRARYKRLSYGIDLRRSAVLELSNACCCCYWMASVLSVSC